MGSTSLFAAHLGAKAGRNVALVTSLDVERWVQNLLTKISPPTAALRFRHLRQVFGYAHRHGVISVNPAAAVPTPQGTGQARDTFTIEEINELLDRLRTLDSTTARGRDLLTLVLLGLCTGARIRDCATMTWGNVDVNGNLLTFVPQKKSRLGHKVEMVR